MSERFLNWPPDLEKQNEGLLIHMMTSQSLRERGSLRGQPIRRRIERKGVGCSNNAWMCVVVKRRAPVSQSENIHRWKEEPVGRELFLVSYDTNRLPCVTTDEKEKFQNESKQRVAAAKTHRSLVLRGDSIIISHCVWFRESGHTYPCRCHIHLSNQTPGVIRESKPR